MVTELNSSNDPLFSWEQTDKMKSKIIYLRAIEPDDYLVSYHWRNDFDIIRAYSMPRYVSKETERKWALKAIEEHEKGISIRLSICTVNENKLIGYINLLNINHQNKSCETSILIGDREYHGQGIASEAREIIFNYGFLTLGLVRIWSRILHSNKAAIKNVEKFGYVKEGTLRKAIFKNGEFHDVYIYSMLREEFLAKYFES